MKMGHIMKDLNTRGYGLASITPFILGSIGLAGVLFLDKFYWRTGVFPEGRPDFSFDYLMRSAVIFISLCAVYWGLIGGRKPQLVILKSDGMPIERLSILGTLLVSIIFLFLFIFKSSVFSVLSFEDGLIEWCSAILLLGACIIFLVAFARYRNYLSIPKITQWTFVFLAFVFFIIAMEEISWFQRVIEVKTPVLFKDNMQNEINFHNFATDKVENIYYFGAFLFLVALPFLRVSFSSAVNNNYLRLFVPRPFISIIAAVACAYNFYMWNIIFIQISFFGSVIILFAFAIYCNNWNERGIIVFTISLIVITQAFFLSNGDNFYRTWEVTEYKEFLIPLAFFVYSLSVYSSVGQVYLEKERSYSKLNEDFN